MPKKTNVFDGLAAAESTLADLEARKAALDAQKEDIEARKVPLAYDALTGNVAAAAAVAEIDAEAVRIQADLRTYTAAIITATANLAAAREIVANMAERKAADGLQRLADEFRAVGAEMDAALSAYVAAYRRSEKIEQVARAMEPRIPEVRTMAAVRTRILHCTLMQIDPRNYNVWVPHRTTAAAVHDRWAEILDGHAKQRRVATSGRAAA